jgi:predicted transposase YdaD
MPNTFDATSKYLIDLQPSAWAKLFGYASRDVKVCNIDLSTVTASADAVLMIGRKIKEALHIEFQSRYDKTVGLRALLYSLLASKTLGVSVRSVILLLRPEADGPEMNGVVRKKRVDGKPYLEFHYDVVRVWQLSPEDLLKGELGTLPLAFIANITRDKIPSLFRRVAKRLAEETDPGTAKEIWTTVKVLMGLKYEDDFVMDIFERVSFLEDSTTYQAMVRKGKAEGEAVGKVEGKVEGKAEGKVEEARSLLIKFGAKKLGKPDVKTIAKIDRIRSLERLEDLIEHVFVVASWKELFSK